MLKRREFLKTSGAAAASALVPWRLPAQAAAADELLRFDSGSMQAQLSPAAPAFLSFNIDGLGKSRRGANIVDAALAGSGFEAAASVSGGARRVKYRAASAGKDVPPAWTFEFTANKIVLISEWSTLSEVTPMVFHFKLDQVHSTVLGIIRKDKLLAAPALLHFPGQGSIRLTASLPEIGLDYKSVHPRGDVKASASLALPAATAEQKRIAYTLEITAIYPHLPGIDGGSRFDAFRRNWLDGLQLNPEYPALANNTASDTCAFCYYEFADIASLTPPLAEGLTALDLVRQTLDRILVGGTAYGLPHPGWECCPSAFSDSMPAMIIAASSVVREGRSDTWLAANYAGIKGWADGMIATDTDGDGLFKYSVSGNSGIWKDGAPTFRPSNWWDTIGFGHEDAYGNALAYRALHEMAMMAKRLDKTDDTARYTAAAEKLHGIYYQHFYNPETGVLGGWRSADGKLHDYYFLWVNGIAIHYGLVEKPQANAIMDKLMTKMKEVGYDRFNMGLPGNLVPVATGDCVDKRGKGRFGCGVNPDNSDGFQKYENGGATGAFTFFTIAALYDLGRREEADEILSAMLSEYDRCGFERRGVNGWSNDWRQWDGTPWGYEGLLADDYYALLAVPVRQSQIRWNSGFCPRTTLT